MEKNCKVGQALDDNMAHYMLETWGYRPSTIINTYVFSTTTMVARKLPPPTPMLRYTYIAGLFHSVNCKL